MTLQRAPLPPDDEPFSAAVEGPEGQVLYVTGSRGRGVRFHFDRGGDPAYRDRFLRHFADYAKRMGRELDEADANKDSYYEDRPMRWLEDVERQVRLAAAGTDTRDRMVGAHIVG